MPAPMTALRPSTRSADGAVVDVVLDLDQADDVGVDRRQRRDDLVALPVSSSGDVRAAALLVVVGPADAPAVIDRREVVEDVEGGDLNVAAHRFRGGRPRVDSGVVGALRRLDAVEAERVVEYARHVGDGVATAEQVVQVEHRAVRVDRRVGILVGASVVERDPVERQLGGGRDGVRCQARTRRWV